MGVACVGTGRSTEALNRTVEQVVEERGGGGWGQG